MEKVNIYCTIFTPTYNRVNLLARLYISLVNQKDQNFEWLIVDDGSKDNTSDVVKKWIEDNKIPIKYIKQQNGGKHRAINNGLIYANGLVFAIVDSDDYLVEDATYKIEKYFSEIKNNSRFKYAGVAFQKGYTESVPVGDSFKGINYVDAKSNERKKYNITGDKFEVFYTSVLKKYPFPEIEGERFMTEALVWTRIAHDEYYLRWYNDIIYICDYLEGGLTDSRDNLIENSPKGYAMYIKEQVKYGNISLKQKLGFYSYYANIREKCGIKKVAEELDTNLFIIMIAYILRKIINITRSRHE